MRLEPSDFRSRPLSLTSLIDVIFLLLLFFMLTSTFTRFTAVELGQTGGGRSPAPSPPALVISLRSGAILLNGVPVEADLAGQLARHKRQGDSRALVLSGVGGTSQQLVSVLEAARKAGIAVSVAR